ncbi:unnamed protein product [Linum tenue]|uniref:Solute carrier family 35 member F1 n=1 Tax=Linum tenue TaxID=586396 RepID=A0AAV0QCG9_9ROSI|nr:unnamed protein product [Linum tenue]
MALWSSKSRKWWAMLLGQGVSLCLALSGFSTSLLASLGVDAPIAQGCFNYFTLALVYGGILLHRRHKLQVSWYWYLLVAFLDVQASFLLNKSYQFSSITSVTLLVCFTIPWVIVLTRVFLGTRYSILQLVGSALCVLGLALVLLSDADGGGGGSMPLLGDTIVIGATILFAFANVSEEFIVKDGGQIEMEMEMLSMMGVFGLLFSLVQLSAFELQALGSVNWSLDMIWAISGYTLSVFCLYSMTPWVLKISSELFFMQLSGATMLSLSSLTSNMWAVVIRTFLFHQKVDWLYFLAFAVVILGLVIYSTNEKAPVPDHDLDGGSSSRTVCQGLLADENGAAIAGNEGSVP